MKRLSFHLFQKILSINLSILLACPYADLAAATSLPASGLIPPIYAVQAPILRGIRIFPQDPFQVDFLLTNAAPAAETSSEISSQEALTLVKYFMAALTIPEKELWVNLSPAEPDRIIPGSLAQTEFGRDLLSQDLELKKLTARLLDPDSASGKAFWEAVYGQWHMAYGERAFNGAEHMVSGKNRNDLSIYQMPYTNDLIQTFNKVWIVPDIAEVVVLPQGAFIRSARLKVMTEQEHLANGRHVANPSASDSNHSDLQDPIRKMILPAIEDEVNHGEQFAPLRQMYHALILALWFKRHAARSIVGSSYVNQSKVAGIVVADPEHQQRTYRQYLEAFARGSADGIREEYDPALQDVVARKYFTGGIPLEHAAVAYREIPGNPAQVDFASLTNPARLSIRVEPVQTDGAMMSKEKSDDKEGDPEKTLLNILRTVIKNKARATGQSPEKIRQTLLKEMEKIIPPSDAGDDVKTNNAMMSPQQILAILKKIARSRAPKRIASPLDKISDHRVRTFVMDSYESIKRDTQPLVSDVSLLDVVWGSGGSAQAHVERVLRDPDALSGSTYVFNASFEDVLGLMRSLTQAHKRPVVSFHRSRAVANEWLMVKGQENGDILLPFSLDQSAAFDRHFYLRPPSPRAAPTLTVDFDMDLWTEILGEYPGPVKTPSDVRNVLEYKDIAADMFSDSLMPSETFIVTRDGLFHLDTDALQEQRYASDGEGQGHLAGVLKNVDVFLESATGGLPRDQRPGDLIDKELIRFKAMGWNQLERISNDQHFKRPNVALESIRSRRLWKSMIRWKLLSRLEKTSRIFKDKKFSEAWKTIREKQAFVPLEELRGLIAQDMAAAQMIVSDPKPVNDIPEGARIRSFSSGNTIMKALWYEASNPAAPVVVFVPPFGQSVLKFTDLFSIYRSGGQDAHVVMLDPPGYALTGGEFRALGLGDHRDLQSVLEQIRSEFPQSKVIVHGMSMGGIVSSQALAERPDLVDGLIIQSVPSSYYRSFIRWMSTLLRLKWDDWLKNAYSAFGDQSAYFYSDLAEDIYKMIFNDRVREFYAYQMIHDPTVKFHQPLRYLTTLKKNSKVPVTILHGRGDALIPERERKMFKSKGQTVTVPGGHNEEHLSVEGANVIVNAIRRIVRADAAMMQRDREDLLNLVAFHAFKTVAILRNLPDADLIDALDMTRPAASDFLQERIKVRRALIDDVVAAIGAGMIEDYHTFTDTELAFLANPLTTSDLNDAAMMRVPRAARILVLSAVQRIQRQPVDPDRKGGVDFSAGMISEYPENLSAASDPSVPRLLVAGFQPVLVSVTHVAEAAVFWP